MFDLPHVITINDNDEPNILLNAKDIITYNVITSGPITIFGTMTQVAMLNLDANKVLSQSVSKIVPLYPHNIDISKIEKVAGWDTPLDVICVAMSDGILHFFYTATRFSTAYFKGEEISHVAWYGSSGLAVVIGSTCHFTRVYNKEIYYIGSVEFPGNIIQIQTENNVLVGCVKMRENGEPQEQRTSHSLYFLNLFSKIIFLEFPILSIENDEFQSFSLKMFNLNIIRKNSAEIWLFPTKNLMENNIISEFRHLYPKQSTRTSYD